MKPFVFHGLKKNTLRYHKNQPANQQTIPFLNDANISMSPPIMLKVGIFINTYIWPTSSVFGNTIQTPETSDLSNIAMKNMKQITTW